MKKLENKGLYPKYLIKVDGLTLNPQELDEDYSPYFRLDQAGLLSECLELENEYLLSVQDEAIYNQLSNGSIYDLLSNAKRLGFIANYEIEKVK